MTYQCLTKLSPSRKNLNWPLTCSGSKDFLFPFPLPSNFSGDIESDLKSGVMTSRTMAAFMTAVAHSVFAQKRYPTHSDLEVVARSILHKYPFLSSAKGNGYVSLPVY